MYKKKEFSGKILIMKTKEIVLHNTLLYACSNITDIDPHTIICIIVAHDNVVVVIH